MSVKVIKELGYAINSQNRTSAFHGMTVEPTYFFDKASQNAQGSAESWASARGTPVKAKFRPNTPMKNLYIDNIEFRDQGGRAYKVINMDDMTYFDVREDQMIQCILRHGIAAGGKMGGEWVFAMHGSQCKVMLTDDKEYMDAVARSVLPVVKVTPKNYKFGEIYTNKSQKEEFIYVGLLPRKQDGTWVSTNGLSQYSYGAQGYMQKNPDVMKHTFIRRCGNENYRYLSYETPATVYATSNTIEKAELKKAIQDYLDREEQDLAQHIRQYPQYSPYVNESISLAKVVLESMKEG